MKILALTRYSRLGASTRLRALQYLPALERAGLQIEVAPFFDDAYLTDLYSGRRNLGRTLGYFTQRIKHMRKAGDTQLIWIEKEALPWMPWALERAMLPRDVPYVVDYDDAVFHRYDQSPHRAVRAAVERQPLWPVATTTLAGGADRRAGLPAWRSAPPAKVILG
ncbi:hypothetical protein LY56_02526 [Roseinatronobacter thiooxidans]|uniref:Glycosyl transferase family 1 n=1 Tax=Roseinatronobacter thiooxidans TaxID=121821 RepID=A0A2W7PYN9_9RHOB|nr:hypothetical protein [Roseinatronobacter thiooxidans]PZX40643.1 hypothetical protein LY56_02526 [Roseinatronobacter thiooxidans]